MKQAIVVIVLLVMCAGVVYLSVQPSEATFTNHIRTTEDVAKSVPTAWDRLKAALAKSEKTLVEIAPRAMDARSALIVETLSCESLHECPLLLAADDGTTLLEITARRTATHTPNCRLVHESCQMMTDSRGTYLIIDGQRLTIDVAACRRYRICDHDGTYTPTSTRVIPVCTVKDGFMRTKLPNGAWKSDYGNWRLKKYGGGLPANEKQMKSHLFARTVNPFSVCGQGILTHKGMASTHHLGSAAFYFGTPWKEGCVDKNTLPTTRFMITVIHGDGYVGFGWDGERKRFVIAQTMANGAEWRILAERIGPRPPISNWVSVGLQIRYGTMLEGVLDGKVVLRHELNTTNSGPFSVFASGGAVEFDDFAITPIATPRNGLIPIFVKSKNFAGKREIKKKTRSWVKYGLQESLDSKHFVGWARGESTYVVSTEKAELKGYRKRMLLTRWPLVGDFEYESLVTDDKGKELPPGIYEFDFLVGDGGQRPVYSDLSLVQTVRFVYDGETWNRDGGEESQSPVVLKFRRRASEGNVLKLVENDVTLDLGGVNEPVYLGVGRLTREKSKCSSCPSPEHHRIRSSHRVNELFEHSPTDWSWIDGGFRMDSRWACAGEWNFMACGSIGVPMLVGKRLFRGDQRHDYFVTLRPMLPSDAGDPYFTFDFRRHIPFQSKFNDWMNRHDLNVSFCMDGKNPMSGYTVIFGDDENGDTLLMRKGKVIARNKECRFPKGNYRATHWKWWNFSLSKTGNRIRVYAAGEPIFDFVDEEPIDGGHLAFWTVKNGFILSKVTSSAKTIDWRPETLYVDEDDEGTPWKPLLRDAVTLKKDGELTRVTAQVGVGEFAVRHYFRPTVILRRTPILEFPISIPKNARVNVHLHVDDKAYVIKVNAPLEGCKSLLTPEFEPLFDPTVTDRRDVGRELFKNEMFQRKRFSLKEIRETRLLGSFSTNSTIIHLNVEDVLKVLGHKGFGLVRSITIGNSSNTKYLQAGVDGNTAGTHYSLGKPRFISKR